MKVKGRFDHFNIDVTNLEQSIRFYETALGLHEANRKVATDGSFILVYMADEHSNFLLELTWLRDHPQPYELGENESHLCLRVEGDYDEVRKFIKKWDVYVMKIQRWGYTSLMIRMIIGLKYYR